MILCQFKMLEDTYRALKENSYRVDWAKVKLTLESIDQRKSGITAKRKQEQVQSQKM